MVGEVLIAGRNDGCGWTRRQSDFHFPGSEWWPWYNNMGLSYDGSRGCGSLRVCWRTVDKICVVFNGVAVIFIGLNLRACIFNVLSNCDLWHDTECVDSLSDLIPRDAMNARLDVLGVCGRGLEALSAKMAFHKPF